MLSAGRWPIKMEANRKYHLFAKPRSRAYCPSPTDLCSFTAQDSSRQASRYRLASHTVCSQKIRPSKQAWRAHSLCILRYHSQSRAYALSVRLRQTFARSRRGKNKCRFAPLVFPSAPYIIPMPPAPPAGIAGSGSLMFATTDSVVSRVLATLVAFCNALLVTLAGSRMPAFTISTYSSVRASKPTPASDSLTLLMITEPSRPAFATMWYSGASRAFRTICAPV